MATGLPARRAAKSGEETEENADADDVIVVVDVPLREIRTGGLPNGELGCISPSVEINK
jgi:hypothetical protein